MQKDVCLIKFRAELGLGKKTGKANCLFKAEVTRQRLQLFRHWSFARDGEIRLRMFFPKSREGAQAGLESFLFNQAPSL